MDDTHDKDNIENVETPTEQPEGKKEKKHLIRPTWLRRILKTLLCIVIFVLLLPVLIYIPPVQNLLVSIAEKVVHDSTGMKVGIGQFRLKFPLDVHLSDVYVVEATGDTMVRAREAIADVKLAPLFALDVRVNRLELFDGYYRMLSPDSSMLLKVNAGYLNVDDKSSVDIKDSHIKLHNTTLRNGQLSLYMDVWKKQTTPQDTASSDSKPFVIEAENLDIENFRFGMSMLPTIDTLDVAVKQIAIRDVKIDLGENLVRWGLASIDNGDFKYLTPTPEYVKSHPAPPSDPSTGPPMRIMGDTIAVSNLAAFYGVKNAKPQPGFDASYLQFSDVNIGMHNFYNESATVRLPLTALRAKERCGLQILDGHGTVSIDSVGLKLDGVEVRTAYSRLAATADIPFAMMELNEQVPMSVKAEGRIGIPDVEAFMPAVKSFTAYVPGRKPLDFDVDAAGSLSDINISKLNVAMSNILSLKASGKAKNPLDYKKMVASLTFDGTLSDPAFADKLIGINDLNLPAFTIQGSAEANGQNYGADFQLLSDAGDVNAIGHVGLTSEEYSADIEVVDLDVARFVPDLGIGKVTASVNANGRSFNPLSGNAVTDAIVNISSIRYNNRDLHDIKVSALITEAGNLTFHALSENPGLDLRLEGSGTIHTDDYTFDVEGLLNDVNLQTLGFSDTTCYGSGELAIRGNARPNEWIYDVDIDASGIVWYVGDEFIHLPNGIIASLTTNPVSTRLSVNSLMTQLNFDSDAGLQRLIKSFSIVGNQIAQQLKQKNILVDKLSAELPAFTLDVNASGQGLIDQLLSPSGMRLDTVSLQLTKDSLIHGNIMALNFNSPSISLDTLTLNIKERGELLDYRAHLGNRPGTLDEFAKVNLNGYLGNNRVSAFLNQWNSKGEQGYRFGLTAALQDSVVTAHFTPLKATIAYMPWTFNDDNYLDFNLFNKHIGANLQASSAESSILAKTQQNEEGKEEFNLKIDNVHIQEFLGMWAFAPPMTGDLNADLHLTYDNRRFTGKGSVGLQNFVYQKTKVGNFDLDLNAGYGLDGSTDVNAALKVNGEPALNAYANLISSSAGLEPDSIGVSLTRFPLKIANPFLNNNVVLNGYLNGDMRLDGTFMAPILNGGISFDSVTAHVPMIGTNLSFGKDVLFVKNNVIDIPNFQIFAANKNPLTLNGRIDASSFNNISFDLSANAQNMQLINSDKRSKDDLFGKIFMNLGASVKGPMRAIDVKANVNILGTTDATYRLNMNPAELQTQSDQDVVRFVNFNDTTQVSAADSVVESPLAMRINADLTISPGTQIAVLLSTKGTDKVELEPTANLNYSQNFMGDMSMTGTFTLGNGFVRYAFPIIGEKMFTFDPSSTITWNGDVTNPTLNVSATDEIKANATTGNNSRLVNFLVTVNATNTVNNLKASFDLSTNDDLSIENELQSMSADQRQTQAMNLLLYGQYMGQNTKTSSVSGNLLYSLLESQLNSWAAKNIRGVDLSFGVNQYDKTTNGVTNTETSYSYQVTKSLFNNRFKILVGGNYSTDTADDDIAENLISDVAVEYSLKQTQTVNMSVRLFRHIGYESILEGEVTEMGAGFVFKRRLENLKSLFHFKRRKRNRESTTQTDADSAFKAVTSKRDSVANINIPSPQNVNAK